MTRGGGVKPTSYFLSRGQRTFTTAHLLVPSEDTCAAAAHQQPPGRGCPYPPLSRPSSAYAGVGVFDLKQIDLWRPYGA